MEHKWRGLAFGAMCLVAGSSWATDGMLSAGYGMTASGMGGAAMAESEDTFGGANNPASMVWVGNRTDLGGTLFSPIRQASTTNFNGQAGPATVDSGANYFVIPEFGYNHMLNNRTSLGISVYGNGGMNSDYPGNINGSGYNLLGGSGNLGVNLVQLIIAPTLAWKATDSTSIGISPLIGYQEFSAQGLQAFGVQNAGTDNAAGYGVRLGVQTRLNSQLTFGASYASKVIMGRMSKYSTLFTNAGELDLPENWSVGLQWKVIPQLALALDYERINYSTSATIGDSPWKMLQGVPFGAVDGPGFGWSNINVIKLGGEYHLNDNWTLRAGWNHTENPVQSGNVMIDLLVPGVITDHLTLGASYDTGSGVWTVAYVHAFANSVTGPAIQANPGYPGFGSPIPGDNITIRMYQDSIGVAYAWK